MLIFIAVLLIVLAVVIDLANIELLFSIPPEAQLIGWFVSKGLCVVAGVVLMLP